MTTSDILITIQWWIAITTIGMIFLPLTTRIFHSFFDKGYIFSKILSTIFITYALFILGEIHILPFTRLSIIIVLMLALTVNIFVTRRKKNSLAEHIKPKVGIITGLFHPQLPKKLWIIFILEELLFLICILFWALVRSNAPDIHGLEKYMDFGFVNSILRSTYFPPKDMWLAGQPINYYYFGHLATAVLTKLTAIPSNITFNLMIATLFSLCVTASFSIGANLLFLTIPSEKRKHKRMWISIISGGLLTAFLTSCAGNLHILYTFFKAYPNDTPVPLWQLPFLPTSFPNSYWYPNATRFIYHTIHEFPIYSFVVSDLHGHVLDIPFVLLTLAFFLTIIIKPVSVTDIKHSIILYKPFHIKFEIKNGKLLFIPFLLAIMYMTNAWDGLIYLMLTIFLLAYLKWHETPKAEIKPEEKLTKKITTYLRNKLSQYSYSNLFIQLMTLFILFIIFSLPFSLFFKPFANQVGLVCPPQWLIKIDHIGPLVFETNHCQHSPLWQLEILYGFFYFWVLGFLFIILPKWIKAKKRSVKEEKIETLQGAQTNQEKVLSYILIITTISTILILIPEFIYLRDIYTTYFRANTMFKLVYQAFLMLSIVAGFTIAKIMNTTTFKQKLFLFPYLIIGLVITALVSIYPYFAITSYYNNLKTNQGLNGTKYLDKLYPTDAAAITWINNNIQDQPVMLEAQGDSYTDYERVSANTGLPTVLGWTVHEWLWHNSYDFIPPLQTDIQTIYESTDISKTETLIKKHSIQYIFLGQLEYEKYHVNQEKFAQLGKIVYQNGTTIIYQITN